MPSPAISVVLPIYNAAATLSATLESVLGQTYPDFEVLAIDDGSTDGTADILARYAKADSRILVTRTPNRGIVAALNGALDMARGDYIARMDADDVCLPQRFERQVAHLEAHPDCVVVGTLVTVVDADGVAQSKQPRLAAGHHLKDRCHNFRKFPPSPPTVAHPTAMMRSAALAHIGGYRSYFATGAEDRDLWWRLMPLGEMHCIPERLLAYRVHEGNRSTQLRTGAVADALVSDFSAVARHFGLSDRDILESYGPAKVPETVERYAHLVGDRFPIRALAQYRSITRKIPSMLREESVPAMRREALRHILSRSDLGSAWRLAWSAMHRR